MTDQSITDILNAHEKRIAALEAQCQGMRQDIDQHAHNVDGNSTDGVYNLSRPGIDYPAPVAADKPAAAIKSDSMGAFMSQMYAGKGQPAGDDAAQLAAIWEKHATDAMRRARVAEDKLAGRERVIEAALRELPVGNMHTHTADSIPGRIAHYVAETGRLDRMEAERDKALAELAAEREKHAQQCDNLAALAAMTERAEKAEDERRIEIQKRPAYLESAMWEVTSKLNAARAEAEALRNAVNEARQTLGDIAYMAENWSSITRPLDQLVGRSRSTLKTLDRAAGAEAK